eukprot:3726512-Amphidinium_carterae.1
MMLHMKCMSLTDSSDFFPRVGVFAWLNRLLGVRIGPIGAGQVIRKRFRKLVATEHPDRKPNDPEALENFRKIAAAYEALMEEDTAGRRKVLGSVEEFAKRYRSEYEYAAEFLGDAWQNSKPQNPYL